MDANAMVPWMRRGARAIDTQCHMSLRKGEAWIWRERIKVDIEKCGDVEGKEQEQEERATGGSLQASCAALGGVGSVRRVGSV